MRFIGSHRLSLMASLRLKMVTFKTFMFCILYNGVANNNDNGINSEKSEKNVQRQVMKPFAVSNLNL